MNTFLSSGMGITIIVIQVIANIIAFAITCAVVDQGLENSYKGYAVCCVPNVIATIHYLAVRFVPMEQKTEWNPPLCGLIGSIIFTLLVILCTVISSVSQYNENKEKERKKQIKRICDNIGRILNNYSSIFCDGKAILTTDDKDVLKHWQELFENETFKTDCNIAQVLKLTVNQLDMYSELSKKADEEDIPKDVTNVTALTNLKKCIDAYRKQKKEEKEQATVNRIAELQASLASVSQQQADAIKVTIEEFGKKPT